MPETEVKDPAEQLDYMFDFTNELAAGETITAQTVVSEDASVTVSGVAQQSGKVVVFADGGVHGTTVPLRCTATTSAGRRYVRRTYLLIRQS